MGLCIRELKSNTSDSKFAWMELNCTQLLKRLTLRKIHIHSVFILRHSYKKDITEISPEQLSAASTEVERLTGLTGHPMRVAGWYPLLM